MRKEKMKRFGQGGFTLIEMSVAILLLAVGMVALWSAILSGLMLVESGRNVAQASEDARTVLEEVRRLAGANLNQVTSTNWGNWAANPNGGNLTDPNFRTTPPPLANETVTVTFIDPADDPLIATVTVAWVEKARPKSASVTALVTRR